MKREKSKFSAVFKSKVAIEALKEQMTLQELAKKYDVHPNQIIGWKREFLENTNVVSLSNSVIKCRTSVSNLILH